MAWFKLVSHAIRHPMEALTRYLVIKEKENYEKRNRR